MKIGTPVILGLVAFPVSVSAAPGDFRVIDGTLIAAGAQGTATIARIDGDDGVSYYADLRGARWDPLRLRPGALVTLAGYEGAQPNQITAAVLDARETAAPAASPATNMPPSPPEREPPADRVEGRVESIAGNILTLRSADGRPVRVDLGQVRVDIRTSVGVGDRVTVFGRYTDRQELLATGFYAVRAP